MAGRNAGWSAGWSAGRCAGRSAGISVQSTHTRTCRRRSRAATLVGATETHDVLASVSAVVVKQRKQSRILSARGRRTANTSARARRTQAHIRKNVEVRRSELAGRYDETHRSYSGWWPPSQGSCSNERDHAMKTLIIWRKSNVGRLGGPVFSFDSSARGSGLSRTCRGGRKEGWGGTRLRAERSAQDGGRFG